VSAQPASQESPPPNLSIVVPAFNEESNLEALLLELRPVLAATGRAYEIVVVDDGSTDGTAAALARARSAEPALRVLSLVRRCGQSAAFAAGFDEARGEIVVTLDADLQNDPADIPRLLALLGESDVVCGVRRNRRDRALRRLSSRVANRVRRAILGDSLRDVGCSLKAFRRQDLRYLPRFDGVHRFYPVFLAWQGRRVAELEVNHRPRRAGTPKYNMRNRAFRTFLDLLAVRWMRSRPLRYEIKR
jgi:glycosyltransferase involved in cell wall biosynthesis